MTPLEISDKLYHLRTEYNAHRIINIEFQEEEDSRQYNYNENILELSLDGQKRQADYVTLKMLSSLNQQDILTWLDMEIPVYESVLHNQDVPTHMIANCAAILTSVIDEEMKNTFTAFYHQMSYIYEHI